MCVKNIQKDDVAMFSNGGADSKISEDEVTG